MNAYHDARLQLPAGVLTPDNGTGPNLNFSWGTLLLPYIEQATIYNALAARVTTPKGVIDDSQTGTAIGQTPAIGSATYPELASRVPVYFCPSDPLSRFDTTKAFGGFSQYGRGNYVCNREVLGPITKAGVGGVFPARTKLVAISDGASNTFVVGERDATTHAGAIWAVRSISDISFEGRPGYGINAPWPYVKTNGVIPDNFNASGTNSPTGYFDIYEKHSFGSLHPGGVNFVFCDGSVRFIANSVESDTAGGPPSFFIFPANYANVVLNNLYHPDDGYVIGAQSY